MQTAGEATSVYVPVNTRILSIEQKLAALCSLLQGWFDARMWPSIETRQHPAQLDLTPPYHFAV